MKNYTKLHLTAFKWYFADAELLLLWKMLKIV